MTVFCFEDHPFWEFSLRVYGNEGVPTACLALQERHAIDVNMLLFCAWIGESGRGLLSESDLESALVATMAWNQDIVCSLRAVRNQLKDGMPPIPTERTDALRKMILEVEVKCEHVEQMSLAAAVVRLADSTTTAKQRSEDAVINVMAYFRRHGFSPDPEDAMQVATVLSPAFPGLGRVELEESLLKEATA